MELNVFYQFNEKYVPYAGVSITSLFENNKDIESINIYILGEGLSKESIAKFQELTEKYERNIIFKSTIELIDKMKEWKLPAYRGSYAANIRMFFPGTLDESIDRILYLDADTIVNQSLRELFEIDLGEYSMAMVLDSLGHKHKLSIGLSEEEYYYNSGMILFNVPCWKDNKCSERIVEYIKSADNILLSAPDQDLLNIVCKNEIKCISPKYNFQPVHLAFSNKNYYFWYGARGYYDKTQLEEAADKPVVYHFFRFLGEFPWHKGNLHPDKELFDKYMAISLWKDYERKSAESSGLMIIEKKLYCALPRIVFLGIFKIAHGLYVEKKAEITVNK